MFRVCVLSLPFHSAIKRNLTRLNLQGHRSSSNAQLNFLSASWLSHDCGLEGVAKAVRIYQDSIEDQIDPNDAFQSVQWLTQLEPDAS